MSYNANKSGTRANSLLLILSLIPLLIGISSLIGWFLNKELLTSFGLGLVPMAPITAILLVTLSLLFIVNLNRIAKPVIKWVTAGFTILVILMAIILFTLSIFEIHFGFEHLWIPVKSAYPSTGAGHMSPVTAVMLATLGFSFLIVRLFKRTTFTIIIPTALAGFTALLSLAFCIGYIVGEPLLYGINLIPPALNTSFCMLSLSIAFTTESILYEKLGLEAITSMDDRFRNVFEHSAEGRTMIFPDGTFQVNKAFGDMLGYTISELNALTWIPVTHPEDQKISKENMELLIQNRAESVRFDKRYLHKNGQTVWVDFQSYLQRDKDGNPLYFINSASDITATKDLQEQLIQARDQAERANKLKDAFIANMSHEIRTPLNAILGFSDLLHDEISQKGLLEYESYFDIIQSSGIRLMRTVDMILNISRLQVGAYIQHPVRLSLSKMIADLVNEYRLPATKKGLTIEFHSRVNEPEILADEYCILHSISNLIDNAIKYTRSGSIHLTLYHSENQLICLEVKDTGIGIAEEYMTQIFNPFTQEETSSTRNFEGIGLGLSLAYRMLGVTGSTLSVKSLKGQGTTFTITFPRTATLS